MPTGSFTTPGVSLHFPPQHVPRNYQPFLLFDKSGIRNPKPRSLGIGTGAEQKGDAWGAETSMPHLGQNRWATGRAPGKWETCSERDVRIQ